MLSAKEKFVSVAKLMCLSAGVLGGGAIPARAALFDHSTYDTILQHYVDVDGDVDYAGIRDNSESALDSYIESLGDADLGGWPPDERLAFWINAYNARVLQLIATHPKLHKLSENLDLLSAPFKVAGTNLSPNGILYRILRNRVNPDDKRGPIDGLSMSGLDPRYHFALVNGTLGAPPLRNTAYTAETVQHLLHEDAINVANNPHYVDVRDGRLHMSRLFKWYKRDFQPVGGVPAFLGSLMNPDLRMDAEMLQQQLTTLYSKTVYDYDWTINDVKNKTASDQATSQKKTSASSESDASSPQLPPESDDTAAVASSSDSQPAPTDGGPSAPLHPSVEDLSNQ